MPLRQLHPDAQNTSEDTTTIDIIAVHGLNPRSKSDSEHAWDTWRAPGPEGQLWLRDELPHHIPHSRVFLYQYNSTAVYGKDQSTFVDKANAFLESIRLKRRGHEQRPLLLLGHSLGGLLIKQALINAFNNEKYEQVRLATKGLAFFATPHGGGDKTLVSIGSAAAKIAIGLGFQKGDNILETLDNGSLFADLMHEHWKQRLLDFDIVSFWGTLDRIVTKESSSFGLPGNRENVVTLEADHSGVCKFGNSETDRDNFERVLGNVQDLVENAFKISSRPNENSTKTKMVRKLLRKLYTTPYKDLKDRNPERVPGTCEWFTSHGRFKHWRESDNSSLLWVSADPGCGKSVLTKYLVDNVLPSTTTSTTCYFFFKDDSKDQRIVENALRCILRQLFDQRKDLLSDELLEKFETSGAMLFNSFSELWHLLTSVARHKNAGKIMCFLDALDECEERGRVRLARALNELYKIESSAFALKFLITSRPYASIQLEFQLLENERPTIHLQGENQIETDKISREIDVVIKHKVETIGSELGLQPHEATQLYLKLTSIPHRTYLWVYLTFNEIRSSKGFNLEDTIYHLPQTVEEAYERILNKSSNATTAKRLLHIVLAASRPLNLHEMVLALDLRLNVTPHHANQPVPKDRVRRTIRDLCGLFVIVIDSKVYLLHQTAREFLLGNRLSQGFQWGGSFHLRESNLILATICVRSLLYITNDLPNNQSHGLFDYAAQNWALHFRKSSRCIDDSELVGEALQLCYPQSEPCVSWVKSYRAIARGDFPGDPTSLILASFFGLFGVVNKILCQGSNNLRERDTQHHRTALTWASYSGHERVVKLILERLTMVTEFFWRRMPFRRSIADAQDVEGKTALAYAAIHGHCDIADLLIEKRASVNIRDEYGQTPISWAVYYGRKEMIELLRKHGARLKSQNKKSSSRDISRYTPLSFAILRQQNSLIQMLLDTNTNVEAKSINGRRPLHHAVVANDIKTIGLLLRKGANIDPTDSHGYTPLHIAAMRGHVDTIQLFLRKGADIEANDNKHRTPLHLAAMRGHVDTIRLLLRKGANIEANDNQHRTPLHLAAMRGHVDTIRLLLRKGADIEANDNKHQTPLHLPVMRGHVDTIRLLLRKGAKIEANANGHRMPLHIIAKLDDEHVIRMLLRKRGKTIRNTGRPSYSS